MMKKNNLIFLYLFILILTAGFVSASSDNETLSVDNEVISLNESLKTLNGGTFEDIQKVVDESGDGDVIELSGKYIGNGSGIYVDKNLTINGVNGAVLDGKNISGFFYCSSEKYVVLNGLTFVDANQELYFDSMTVGYGKILNCNFINNNVLRSYNSCSFINCSFENSLTVSGAGDVINCSFLNSSDSGAIYGAKNVINCSFMNNSALYGSGAISNVGSVINCSFVNNVGGSYGAIDGAGDVLNCKFINNSAVHDCSGAIYNVGQVINCLFENNSVKDAYIGSASAVYESKDIINCIFINNSINGKGFVVFESDDIIGCSFINNSVSYPVHVKSPNHNCSIINSNFVNTRDICYSADIVNSTFENSQISNLNSNRGKIIDCNFINHIITDINCNVSLINCNFTGNGYGEPSICQLRKNAYIVGCNFFNFGSVKLLCPYPYVVDCKFVKTSAFVGLDYTEQCYSQVINCTFESANMYYALNLPDGNASVIGCNFSKNNAGSIDIGIQAKNRMTNIKNCNFIGNSGGSNVYGSNFNVMGCNFLNNSANSVSCLDYAMISDCKFVSNSARAISCYNTTVVNCDFIKNSNHNSQLFGYGGAIDCDASIVKNCNFIGNSADNGGAIRGAQSQVDNCIFKDNVATCHGSAIVVPVPDNNLVVSNCVFSNNRAKLTRITLGYPVVNYGNGAIAKSGDLSGLRIIDCTGLSKNNDKYKVKTNIAASPISFTYNGGKYLIICMGNSDFADVPIAGLKVTIKLNGKTYNKVADDKGQVKLLINLPVNTYTAKITFAGDNYYLKSTKDVKITVKKATPTITAQSKTFKKSDKSKKYTVTLKNNNNVMKNTKLTLKVDGKTYSATTNAKGQATFKLSKLTKKGSFTAAVKYSGSKYYNAKIVKPKITVK